MLVGERTGRRWSLGDEMEIVVAQVDMDDYKIELLLADSVGRPSKKRRSSRKPASAKRAESRSSDNRAKPSVREQLKHGLPKKEKTKLKVKAKKKKSSTIQKKKATRRKDRQALKRK
jgi:ribonuclease R